MIRTQGNTRKTKEQAPKPVVRWHKVLMTHAAGTQMFKQDSYRAITSRQVAEELITKGIIDKEGLKELPEGLVTVKTNPSEALPDNGRNDKEREIRNQAAKNTWKPGMKTPPRKDQPTHGLPKEQPSAEDAQAEAELKALAGDEAGETPAGDVQEQVRQARRGSK